MKTLRTQQNFGGT